MKNLQKLYILEMRSTLLESQISDISIRLQSLHKDMSKLYLEKKNQTHVFTRNILLSHFEFDVSSEKITCQENVNLGAVLFGIMCVL